MRLHPYAVILNGDSTELFCKCSEDMHLSAFVRELDSIR